MKRIAVLILALIVVLGVIPFTALPAEAGIIGEMDSGSFGKIFWSGRNPTGNGSGTSGYQIGSDAEADTALYAVNYNYAPAPNAGLGRVGYTAGLAKGAKLYSSGTAINIVLNHDWTTSHFITANCHINIDLNGYTWTVTGEEVMNTSDKNVSISGGTMVFTNAESGPIRTIEKGNLTIRDVVFRDCKCDESGIVFFSSYYGKLYLENVDFENCSCDGWGGCVYVANPMSGMNADWRPQVIFKNCNFTDCHSYYGGGVFYSGLKQCDITFEDCFFLFDRSDKYCGGVIYANGDDNTYKFRNCAVYNCYAYDAGGFAFVGGTHNSFIGDPDNFGDYPDFSSENLKDKYNMDTRTTVCGCYATGSGGAIYVSNTAGYGHYCKIKGFNFVQNTAGSATHTVKSIESIDKNEWGGALCLRGEYAEVECCDFIENYAHYYGGAIYLGDNDSSVKYCVFRDSWSDPNYKGEDIFNDDYNNTISDNIYYSDRVDTIYMYYSGTNTNNTHYAKKTGGRLAGLSGSGTADDPWRVTCSRAMLDLAMNVSSGVTYAGKYFLVTKDIPNVYVPIGNSKVKFEGNFDGGNHFFTAYMRSDGNNVGIFGYSQSATIKNMHVKEGFLSGITNVGGICAEAHDTTFLNCSNAATVNSKKSGEYIGGIAGQIHGDVRFEKCTNDGKIYGAKTGIGGIAGGLLSPDEYDTDSFAVFDTCRNNGYIWASAGGGNNAGGIIGGLFGETTFKNCVNTGTVEVKDKYAGGIVGSESYSPYYILNCMNSGKIIAATSNAGGIIGYSMVNGGTKQIINCANYGEISAPKELGGILTTLYEMPSDDSCLGAPRPVDVKNCYGDGTMPFNHNCGAIVAGAGLGNFVNCITNANRPVTDSHSTILSGNDADIKAVRQLNIYISQHPSETDGWTYWYINPATERAEPDFLTTKIGKYSGSGTKDNPYLIEKTSDLRYLELELAQGKNVNGKYFLLKKDVSYTGTPIGDGENPFGGIFDGGGHTITVTIKGVDNVGLFGMTVNADIKNLNITGSVNAQGINVGGIVGYSINTTFTSCSNSSTVVGNNYVGGIAGASSDCSFTDCTNNGTIKSNSTDGAGICGSNWGNVTFLRCCNNGPISTAVITAGGIAGVIWQGCTVLNCVNTLNGAISCPVNVGGIVGCIINESGYAHRIENCANLGNVTADNSVGGIIHNECSNTTVRLCFSAGTIKANDGWGYAAIVQGTQVNYPDCFAMEGIGHTDAKAETLAKKKCGLSLVNKINKIVSEHPEKKDEWTNWGLDMASHCASPLGTGGDFTSLKGSGTEEDPYLISSTSDLGEITARLIEGCDTAETHYLLTNDIPDYVGSPVGTAEYPFIGIFDGNGYTVTIADMNAAENVGLFGFVEGGKIINLSVTGKVTGTIQNVGAVAGNAKDAEISNCSSTAIVFTLDGNGVNNVGGICGNATGKTAILNCYVSAAITGSGRYVGGIAGMIGGETVIRNCVKLETVIGSDCVGGIVGAMEGNCAVENCANYGSVTGTGAVNTKAECSAIGGIAGKATGGKIFVCFVAGVTEAAKGVSFTEKSRGTFVGEVSGTSCTELHYYKGVIDTSIPAAGNNSDITATARKKADCQAKLCTAANTAIKDLSGYSKWVIGGAEINRMAIPGNYTIQRRNIETASVFTGNTPLVLTICGIVTVLGIAAAILFGRKKRKKDEQNKKDQ